jgi:hypothetical protein
MTRRTALLALLEEAAERADYETTTTREKR